MNPIEMREIRARVMVAVRQSREVVGALAAEVEKILASERLTPEARTSDAAALVAQRRENIAETAREGRRILEGARASNDADVARLVAVGPVALEEAERALRPVLNASAGNPELLLNLYRSRHRDNASRLLIEQTAEALIDALGGSDNYAFRDSWNGLQQELAASRSPEEMEANARAQELDEMAENVDAAEAVAMVDLALMDPSSEIGVEERGRMQISRQMSEPTVHAYENEHAA